MAKRKLELINGDCIMKNKNAFSNLANGDVVIIATGEVLQSNHIVRDQTSRWYSPLTPCKIFVDK